MGHVGHYHVWHASTQISMYNNMDYENHPLLRILQPFMPSSLQHAYTFMGEYSPIPVPIHVLGSYEDWLRFLDASIERENFRFFTSDAVDSRARAGIRKKDFTSNGTKSTPKVL